MTRETAGILARALTIRTEVEVRLSTYANNTGMSLGELSVLAETYVHEQRIINRIVSEARDE